MKEGSGLIEQLLSNSVSVTLFKCNAKAIFLQMLSTEFPSSLPIHQANWAKVNDSSKHPESKMLGKAAKPGLHDTNKPHVFGLDSFPSLTGELSRIM